MAKKTFLSSCTVTGNKRLALDIRLSGGPKNEVCRHRKDFGINKIQDSAVRQAVAEHLAKAVMQMAEWLHEMQPAPAADAPAEIAAPKAEPPTLEKAIAAGLAAKLATVEYTKDYKGRVGAFVDWARAQGIAEKPAADLSAAQVREFFDFLKSRRKYRATTIENYLNHLRAVWTDAQAELGVTLAPVWKAYKAPAKEDKYRQVFTPEQRQVIGAYLQENDYFLFRAVLLQFFCYLRPVEICRLRFRDFDFKKGLVRVEVRKGKRTRYRYATMPLSVVHFFADGRFDRYPANYYVYGREWVPNRDNPLNSTKLYRRHEKHLNRLYKAGQIPDPKANGLQFYSWKDSGISKHAKYTGLLSTRDQAGHSDVKITMAYYSPDPVNEEYRKLAFDLFD